MPRVPGHLKNKIGSVLFNSLDGRTAPRAVAMDTFR